MYISEHALKPNVPSGLAANPEGFDELQSSTCQTFFSIRVTVKGPTSSVCSKAGSAAQDANNTAAAIKNKNFFIVGCFIDLKDNIFMSTKTSKHDKISKEAASITA